MAMGRLSAMPNQEGTLELEGRMSADHTHSKGEACENGSWGVDLRKREKKTSRLRVEGLKGVKAFG
jgi:hypothetical protein